MFAKKYIYSAIPSRKPFYCDLGPIVLALYHGTSNSPHHGQGVDSGCQQVPKSPLHQGIAATGVAVCFLLRQQVRHKASIQESTIVMGLSSVGNRFNICKPIIGLNEPIGYCHDDSCVASRPCQLDGAVHRSHKNES